MSRSSWIDGRATFTTVLSSMIMKSPNETAASVHHFRRSSEKIASAMSALSETRVRLDAVGRASSTAANVTRLARSLGCDDYAALHRVSVDEPERFWRAVAEDLELELARPWDRVLDDSRGIEWTTWFEGARLNLATACLHAWAERTPEAPAAIFRGEDGTRREWTFAELSRETVRLAEALKALGVESGDRVAIYMPMSPEAAVASHACAHIGAIQVPIFSGFAAPAIVQRLQDAEAKVVITADYSLRRGTRVPMRETVEEALRESPSVEHVLLWRRETMEWDAELGPGDARAARRRGRASVPARVHLRHDRPPEGSAPRARKLPALDRARGRLPVRHPRRRPSPLRHRHGLDHGAVDGRGRGRARRMRGLHGGRARPARRTGSGGSSRRSA